MIVTVGSNIQRIKRKDFINNIKFYTLFMIIVCFSLLDGQVSLLGQQGWQFFSKKFVI